MCVSVCVYVSKAPANNLQLLLRLHFQSCGALKVSQRGEIRPFLGLFWSYTQPQLCMWTWKFPGTNQSFTAPKDFQVLSFTFKVFWSVSHWPQPAMLLQVVPVLNNCHRLFSAHVLGLVRFSRGISELGQLKTSPENGAVYQATRDVNSDNFEGIGTSRHSKPYGFASSKACEATDFHNYWSFSYSSLPQRKGEMMGLGHTECCKSHCSY